MTKPKRKNYNAPGSSVGTFVPPLMRDPLAAYLRDHPEESKGGLLRRLLANFLHTQGYL
jgi:hypothetical protein